MGSTGHKDYPSTPLPRKLGIREGSRVLLVGAPDGFDLGELPPEAEVVRRASNSLDVIVLFIVWRRDLERAFGKLAASLASDGRLWVAWPKKASKVETDLGFDVVQGYGLEAGLVDNKSASVTEVFQGLQFVYRVEDRPKA
jgi:hypothetical protein